jgi:hypothetical protein
MKNSGFLVGTATLLMHLCICHSQVEGGIFTFGGVGQRSDLTFQREISEIKASLESFAPTDAYPDDSDSWFKLISKDVAANIRMLQQTPEKDAYHKLKKRAVSEQEDESVPRSFSCSDEDTLGRNWTTGCSGYQSSMTYMFGIIDEEDDGLSLDDGFSVRPNLSEDWLLPGDENRIQMAATLSAAAYLSDDELSEIPELVGIQLGEFPLGYRHSSITVRGNTPTLFRFWRFISDPATLYVSFLGIIDKKAHFSDLDTFTAPLSQSSLVPSSTPKRRHKDVSSPKVHSGFLHQFLMIEEPLRHLLEQSSHDEEIERIVYTGHSIGAALATIAGTVTRHIKPDIPITVITFGSPRVGDDLFVEEYTTSVSVSFRVILHDDMVPQIYPIAPSFKHVPGYFCLDCDELESAELSSVSRIQIALNAIRKNVLNRHSFEDYLRTINGNVQGNSGD